MLEVRTTEVFTAWFDAIRDRKTRLRVQVRIDRLAAGNAGQHRVLKGGVCEMKIDHGPGYRVYYTQRGEVLIVLLCGGGQAFPTRGYCRGHRDGKTPGDLR